MQTINIRRRSLTYLTIILVVLTLLFGFGWFNSMVSYKYEVQDSIYVGEMLTLYQKDILQNITISKIAFFTCLALFVSAAFIYIAEPSFKGKIFYYDKMPRK